MEFFKELFLMSEGLDLTIKVKRVKDRLTVSVLPDMAEGVEPLLMTGTWEEFDKEFFNYVKPSIDTARVVMNNVDSFKKQMEELGDSKKKELDQKKAEPVKANKSTSSKKASDPKKKEAPIKKEATGKEVIAGDETSKTKPEVPVKPDQDGPKQLSII